MIYDMAKHLENGLMDAQVASLKADIQQLRMELQLVNHKFEMMKLNAKPAARVAREWYLVQASTFGTDMFATVCKPQLGDAHLGTVVHVREVLPDAE